MLKYILSSDDSLELDLDSIINVNKLWSKCGLEIHFDNGDIIETYYKDVSFLNQDYNYLIYNITNRDESFNDFYKPKLQVARCQCGSALVYGEDTTFHADYCDKYNKG